jgi:antitoxin HicB
VPAWNRLDAVFFRSKVGNEPVREWLKSLAKEQRKAIGEDIAYVQFKWPIGKPHVDHVPGAVFGRRWTIESHERSSRSKVGGWYCSMGSSRKRSARPIRTSIWRLNASRSGNVAKRNVHTGSSLDDFLKEEGNFDEVQAKALKRALAEQLEESMQAANLTKLDMAKKMATSRSQLDRVLDPSNVSVQLDTLIKAARALGKEIEIKIKRAHKKAA